MGIDWLRSFLGIRRFGLLTLSSTSENNLIDHPLDPPSTRIPKLEDRFRQVRLRLFEAMGALRSISPWTFTVLAGCALYALSIGDLALSKAATYNQTFTSLGIDNRILWLLSHGGFQAYNNSGFSQVYGFPYGKWLLVLLLPVYSLVPNLSTVIILQVLATAASALPLYFYARRMLRSHLAGALIALSFLIYYPLTSANLTGDLTIAFFPLLFFTVCSSLASGRRRLAYMAVLLMAGVNGLALFMAIPLIVFGFPVRGEHTVPIWDLKSRLSDLLLNRRKTAIIAALAALTLGYYLLGGFEVVSNSGPSQSFIQIVVFQSNLKILFFLWLLLPLAFLPLLDDLTLLTLIPLAGFIFYSENPGTYVPFGHQYVLMAAAPMMMGLIRTLAWFKWRHSSSLPDVRGTAVGHRQRIPRTGQGRVIANPYYRAFAIFLVLSLVSGVVYFPDSPLNSSVSGGLFAGNWDSGADLSPTAETQFLSRAIELIPPSGSVLTQNNIPQLSSRMYFQIASLMVPGVPFDYVLMDSELNYFTSSDTPVLTSVMNSGLSSGEFGILAEGQGVLLLERGYSGGPLLYLPANMSFDSSNLDLSGGYAVGSYVQNTKSGNSMWFGPYVTLFPGTYTARFTLEVNSTVPASERILTLEATYNSGASLLNYTYLTPANFTAPQTWTSFDLNFTLNQIMSGIELKGVSPAGGITITLASIQLLQATK
jgi:uncharacterized membrane protein